MTTVTCAHRQKTFCIDTLLDIRRARTALRMLSIRETFVSPRRAPALPTQRKLLFQLLLVSLSTGTPPPRRSRGGQTHSRPPRARTGAREERYPHAAIPERYLRAQRQKRGQGTQARWICSASSSCCAATTQHPASRAKAARPEDHPHQEAVTQN